jgi:hypothetical protein
MFLCMALGDVTRNGVLEAVAEFDRLGREAFLRKYGFGPATTYSLVINDRHYDPKAIVGVAHGFDRPDLGPLTSSEFVGGKFGSSPVLERLGFTIEPLDDTSGAGDADLRGDQPAAEASWLFQANPQSWDLVSALDVLPSLQWVTRQSFRQIKPGDPVHFWLAGAAGGVLARGRVLTTPTEEPENASDGVFAAGDAFTKPERRVWVRMERVLDRPIGRDELLEDPDVADMGVLRFANATNFRLETGEARKLVELENAQPGRSVEPEKLFFFAAAGQLASRHLQTSLRDGVPLSQFASLTVVYPQLERHAVEGRVYAWGARPGQAAEKKWERLNAGDVCLVYADSGFALWARVYAKTRSTEVAREIWGEHDGETWDCMFFLYPVRDLGASRERVATALGYAPNYVPQGFEIPSEKPQAALRASYPTMMHFAEDLAGRPGEETSHVWWVCQGKTFAAERDLGLMWAPKTSANGASREFWRALEDARVGDRVLHYANGSIRAVSTVTETAVDAQRPAELAGEWERDGWLVQTNYSELPEPIALERIPSEWRVAERGPFTRSGNVQQGYFFGVSPTFVSHLASRFPELGLPGGVLADVEAPPADYVEPTFETIVQTIREAGVTLDEQTIRRYHISLKTRGFVVLSGLSGSGKTWLAQLYAKAVHAEMMLVSVAPNWTTNEDLLGYYDPLAKEYRHSPFSKFLEAAAASWREARAAGVKARPYHLILDEMNLARVEYYFAKFLSAMEIRAREQTARLELDASLATELTPNLFFAGTVNVDETTHGFADKIYDRAQLIEIPVAVAGIEAHLAGCAYQIDLIAIWELMKPIAPFAYRVLDEIRAYVEQADLLGVPTETAVDEQLLQKVLPKIKGTDKGIGPALEGFIDLSAGRWPLAQAKATEMLAAFETHGIASYF